MSAETKRKLIRLVLLAAVFASLFAVGKLTGVTDELTVERLRTFVVDAGPWGVALYVAAFSAGQLIYVPGIAFVAAAILAYGKLAGFFIAWLAASISVSVSFALVRAVGGKALAELDQPLMKKVLARLDERPLLTVIILRALFAMNPALNYAFALTALRFRDHLLGSVIGLVPQIAGAAILFEWIFAQIGT